MRTSNFRDFMKKYNLRNATLKESEIHRLCNYPIYPRNSKIYSDKGFVNVDNGGMGGSLWTCFISKHNKSF